MHTKQPRNIQLGGFFFLLLGGFVEIDNLKLWGGGEGDGTDIKRGFH